MKKNNLEISLKAARVNAGYTQAEAARYVGKSIPTLQLWEKGERDVPVTIAMKLCELYHFNIDDIKFSK